MKARIVLEPPKVQLRLWFRAWISAYISLYKKLCLQSLSLACFLPNFTLGSSLMIERQSFSHILFLPNFILGYPHWDPLWQLQTYKVLCYSFLELFQKRIIPSLGPVWVNITTETRTKLSVSSHLRMEQSPAYSAIGRNRTSDLLGWWWSTLKQWNNRLQYTWTYKWLVQWGKGS